MVKIILFSALVATALALPHPDNAPYAPPAYGAPSYKEPEPKPQPFAYQYGVKDDYSGNNFDKSESQDDYGNVNGEYRVALPDGRVQIVSYRADDAGGFIADVKYEGTAVYPQSPQADTAHPNPPMPPSPPTHPQLKPILPLHTPLFIQNRIKL